MDEMGEVLQRMRDPLGAPFFPEALRALLVVTWVIHIFFVTLALGSSVITLVGFLRKGDYDRRLARSAARLTPSAVGLGIVTGIAPLLFIQTIYDPSWYAANTLTGFWSVMFVFIVMAGYGFAYLFYMRGSADGRLLWSAGASAALLTFAGFIMHVLASVSIRPTRWMEWYAPDGVIDTRGVEFHSVNVPRLVFLLPLQAALGIAVGGLLYAWYGAKREDPDLDYLRWVAAQARRLGVVVGLLYTVAGLAWGLTEGQEFDVVPLAVPALVGVGLVLTAFFVTMRDPLRHGRTALFVWLGGLLVVAVIREAIRTAALREVGYDVAQYPYDVNWGSAVLFLATTIVGGSIIAYMAMVLYQSGLHRGVTQITPRVDRFGRVATAMLGGWFAFFLAIGLYTVVG
ncbi:MAG: hypothetical protein ACK5RL_09195 [Acidimicrobiales bacterium]